MKLSRSNVDSSGVDAAGNTVWRHLKPCSKVAGPNGGWSPVDLAVFHGHIGIRVALNGHWPVSGLKVIPCRFMDFPYFFKMCDGPAGSRMDRDIMAIREGAEHLKPTEKMGYRHAAEGKVPGVKVGEAWRFRRSEINRWIEPQSAGQKRRGGK